MDYFDLQETLDDLVIILIKKGIHDDFVKQTNTNSSILEKCCIALNIIAQRHAPKNNDLFEIIEQIKYSDTKEQFCVRYTDFCAQLKKIRPQ